MALTYPNVAMVDPPYGDPAWREPAAAFNDARTRREDVLVIGDSQAYPFGEFSTNAWSLGYWINRMLGLQIPGTGMLPIFSAGNTGSNFACAHPSRAVANIGTRDITKYAPTFYDQAIDIGAAETPAAILLQRNAIFAQAAFDDISQGNCSLLERDDTSWHPEVLLMGCTNANVHGGSAGDDVKINGIRGNNPVGYYFETATTQYTSTGLNLSTVGQDVPVRFTTPGPVVWSSSEYLSFYPQCANASKKIRLAGLGWDKVGAPGFRVSFACAGGYKTSGSSSLITTHSACAPFMRAMFPQSRPRLIFIELGENDFGALDSAATWKTSVIALLDFLRATYGSGYSVIWVCESLRGDSVSNANYAATMAQRDQQPGVLQEVRQAGYSELFTINYTRFCREQGITDTESSLTGKTYLGEFRTLVTAAGSVAITQNVHYVQAQDGGGKKKWYLYTGATTTIGASGVISSYRHGPGGDLAPSVTAPANPYAIWKPFMRGSSRTSNTDGAPNDFVHPESDGQALRWRSALALLTGAMVSAIGRADTWRSRAWRK